MRLLLSGEDCTNGKTPPTRPLAEGAVGDLINAIYGAHEPWARSKWERAGRKVELSCLSICLPVCRNQVPEDTSKTSGRT